MAEGGRIVNAADLENGFLDLHGREVHAFSLEMANVGFNRMADLLVSMLRSEAWRTFKDGVASYAFLPGEFDYFLSQQGIRREDVMKLPDVALKAQLETAMDERRTGEEDYRRSVLRVREENPQRPGRPIEPFGYTQAEAKALAGKGGAPPAGTLHREALGTTVRRFTITGGTTTKRPGRSLPMVERLRRSAIRLDDKDLSNLIEALTQERQRRGREADSAPST
jgi:hypothetical protein